MYHIDFVSYMYINYMKQTILSLYHMENWRKLQLEGTDDITSAEAKIAFMSIDPGINVEIINKYLSVSQTAEIM